MAVAGKLALLWTSSCSMPAMFVIYSDCGCFVCRCVWQFALLNGSLGRNAG